MVFVPSMLLANESSHGTPAGARLSELKSLVRSLYMFAPLVGKFAEIAASRLPLPAANWRMLPLLLLVFSQLRPPEKLALAISSTVGHCMVLGSVTTLDPLVPVAVPPRSVSKPLTCVDESLSTWPFEPTLPLMMEPVPLKVSTSVPEPE